MLRHTKNSWNAQWCEPYKTINDLKYNGEYVGVVKIDGSIDPGAETLSGFTGSNFWLTNRTLQCDGVDTSENQWISQIAYSCFNPEIAVRCHSGANTSPEKRNRWSDWEFSVMSGIFKETVTLLNNRGKMDLTRNRNSNLVSIHFHNMSSDLDIVKGRTHIGKITSSTFIPSFCAVLPLITAETNSHYGYGVVECCLVIDSAGEIFIFNERENARTIGNIVEQTLIYNLR